MDVDVFRPDRPAQADSGCRIRGNGHDGDVRVRHGLVADAGDPRRGVDGPRGAGSGARRIAVGERATRGARPRVRLRRRNGHGGGDHRPGDRVVAAGRATHAPYLRDRVSARGRDGSHRAVLGSRGSAEAAARAANVGVSAGASETVSDVRRGGWVVWHRKFRAYIAGDASGDSADAGLRRGERGTNRHRAFHFAQRAVCGGIVPGGRAWGPHGQEETAGGGLWFVRRDVPWVSSGQREPCSSLLPVCPCRDLYRNCGCDAARTGRGPASAGTTGSGVWRAGHGEFGGRSSVECGGGVAVEPGVVSGWILYGAVFTFAGAAALFAVPRAGR